MPNPTTYASARQFVGLAREVTQGTAVQPTVTVPVEKFEPEDKVTWVDDKGLRGSMTEIYNRVQGVKHVEFDMSGQVFFDTIGFLLNNILGDDVESGTYTGSGSTTLSTSATAGASTISTAASIATSTRIQIDTGTASEVRTVQSTSGAGPYTLTLDSALNYAHASSAAVKPITTPYAHTFSLLNSGAAQPGSLTITDFQGTPATYGARAYAGACLSEMTLKGNAESDAITYEAKGTGWPSAIAIATPSSSPSALQPMAGWRSTIGLAGTVGSNPLSTIGEWEIALKRELEPIYTATNTQNPYFIQRGKLTASGKLTFRAAADETALLYLLNNTQPQFQLIASNGLAGASLQSIEFDIQTAAWSTAKIDRSKSAVGYGVDFDAIANTTNAGGSGGYSPISILLQNATVPNTY